MPRRNRLASHGRSKDLVRDAVNSMIDKIKSQTTPVEGIKKDLEIVVQWRLSTYFCLAAISPIPTGHKIHVRVL